MRVIHAASLKCQRDEFRERLQQQGHSVLSVAGGQDIVDELEARQPGTFHAIVTCNKVNQLEGTDLLHFLAAWPHFQRARVPVFVVSEDEGIRPIVEELGGVFVLKSDTGSIFSRLALMDAAASTA
jgi:CheY-like chemotaxis protein